MHRSTIELHRFVMLLHRSTIELLRLAMLLHHPTVELHRPTVELHRSAMLLCELVKINRRRTQMDETVRCAGSQGTPLGGFADLKEVPPRCSNCRADELCKFKLHFTNVSQRFVAKISIFR